MRRKCYPPSSPAGKGAKWECAGSEHSTEWHTFDMDIQCLIEEAWARVNLSPFFCVFTLFLLHNSEHSQGDQTIDMSKTHLGFPYVINFSNLTQRWLTSGYVRSVRRVKQAPYPLVKVRLEELATVTGEFGYMCILFLWNSVFFCYFIRNDIKLLATYFFHSKTLVLTKNYLHLKFGFYLI